MLKINYCKLENTLISVDWLHLKINLLVLYFVLHYPSYLVYLLFQEYYVDITKASQKGRIIHAFYLNSFETLIIQKKFKLLYTGNSKFRSEIVSMWSLKFHCNKRKSTKNQAIIILHLIFTHSTYTFLQTVIRLTVLSFNS